MLCQLSYAGMFPPEDLASVHKSHILHESAIYANHTYHSVSQRHHSSSSISIGCSLTSIDDTRPSCMRITRSAIGAIAELCVTITTVAPFLRLMSCRMRSTCLPGCSQARRSVRHTAESSDLRHRSSDRHTLLLAARQLRGKIVDAVRKPYVGERLSGVLCVGNDL